MSIGENFADLCNLAVAGYVAGTSSGQVKPTTAGVKAAVEAKIVVQEGTQFRLPDGSPLKPNLPKPMLVQPTVAPGRFVTPGDPFDLGYTAALNGEADNPEQSSEWRHGYEAGMAHGSQMSGGMGEPLDTAHGWHKA